jgi:hypothetical protein
MPGRYTSRNARIDGFAREWHVRDRLWQAISLAGFPKQIIDCNVNDYPQFG